MIIEANYMDQAIRVMHKQGCILNVDIVLLLCDISSKEINNNNKESFYMVQNLKELERLM